MSDQIYFSEVPAEAGSSSIARVPEVASIAISQGSGRFARKMERRVEIAAIQERGKAQITSEMIRMTTAISALADHAVALVPSCEQPVRGIVNAYAQTSAAKLAGW